MAIIPTSYYHAGLDLSSVCRNWRQSTNDGTDVRMGNRAAAVVAVANALNRCLAHLPRILFSKAQPLDNSDTAGSDPLYIYAYDDSVENAQDVVTTVLAVPRTAGAGDCYAGRYTGGVVTDKTSVQNVTVASVDEFEDTFTDAYTHNRGAAADAEISEAFSTFNGYTVLDVAVAEKPLSQLDTAIHAVVDPGEAKKGSSVLADIMEDVRGYFHALQVTARSRVFSWAANGAAGSWATPGSTDQTGIVVAAVPWVNLIDQTVSARSATSPGMSAHCQYAGWGARDENNGELIKVFPRVYGSCSGGSANGTVRFHGPNFAAAGGANNYVDITLTHGAANQWWGTSSDYLYLDSTILDTDATTNRNKIDVLGGITGVTTETMYIYGLQGWQTAPPY